MYYIDSFILAEQRLNSIIRNVRHLFQERPSLLLRYGEGEISGKGGNFVNLGYYILEEASYSA